MRIRGLIPLVLLLLCLGVVQSAVPPSVQLPVDLKPISFESGYHFTTYTDIVTPSNTSQGLVLTADTIRVNSGPRIHTLLPNRLVLDGPGLVRIQPGLTVQHSFTAFTDDSSLGGATPVVDESPSERAIREYLEGIQSNVSEKQERVFDSCPPGESIRIIYSDGTVQCEVDTDTTYTAGDALLLSGTQFTTNPGPGVATTGDGYTVDFASCDGPNDLIEYDNGFICGTDTTQTYTGNDGISISGSELSVVAPTCSGKLHWTGTDFACVGDQDTTYSAGQGINLTLPPPSYDLTFEVNAFEGLQHEINGLRVDAPTCSGTDKLIWNNSQFECAEDTYGEITAGDGLFMFNLPGPTIAVITGTGINTDSTSLFLDLPTCTGDDVLDYGGSGFFCTADNREPTLSGGTGITISGNTISLDVTSSSDCSSYMTGFTADGQGVTCS